MGYAYGYLWGEKIITSIENVYYSLGSGWPDITYEKMISRMDRYIIWSDGNIEEVEGCLAGIEAASGSLPVITSSFIEAGEKTLDLDMLLLHNCFGHIMDVTQGCSGFAIWGEATGDGKTRAGANLDYPDRIGASEYLVVVRKPDYGLSTVCFTHGSLFLGGSVGPTKGMNETGLVMVTQGAYGVFNPAWTQVSKAGYTYAMLLDILEQVAAGPDMVTNITEFFQENPSNFSGVLLFAQNNTPSDDLSDDQMAVVIEKNPLGFDIRLPSHNSQYNTPVQNAIFTTNHFLCRQVPPEYETWYDSIDRYERMLAVVVYNLISGLLEMQKVLQGASVPTSIHSVYFEPDSMTIHIAYGTTDGPPSPSLIPITFTWEELFAPIPQ
jgi:hypothetical protein